MNHTYLGGGCRLPIGVSNFSSANNGGRGYGSPTYLVSNKLLKKGITSPMIYMVDRVVSENLDSINFSGNDPNLPEPAFYMFQVSKS